jgi:eukaryotic-like serine/threonine-protein kinase
MSAPELNLGPQYRVLSILAKGGMGAVYLGQMRNEGGDHRLVAIKVMHQHIAESWETLTLFVDEARVGTRIDHPNVVRVLATEVVQETPFLVMEYIEGLSWSRLVRRAEEKEKPIPLAIAARVVRDTLLGLHAAHELRTENGESAQVVHRDVSPQNILVGVDGVVRLTDFGVATFAGRITSTAPGELRGKLGYIAPEQMKKGEVDRRSDVFAAGIVLWEGITGRRLFGADTQAETLARVLSEPIAPPSTHRHEVSLDLDEVCLRALEREKERRFQTALDLANALEKNTAIAGDDELVAFLNDLAASEIEKQRRTLEEAQRKAGPWDAPSVALAPAREEVTLPRVPKPTPWKRWAAGAGAAAVLIVAGLLIGRMSSSSSEPIVATPVPVDPSPTPPPSATIVGASPDPIEVTTEAAPVPVNNVRRPPVKAHKPAASAHPAKSGDTRKYIPGEL